MASQNQHMVIGVHHWAALIQAQVAHLESSLVKTDNAALAQAAATLGPTSEAKNATCKTSLNSKTEICRSLQQIDH